MPMDRSAYSSSSSDSSQFSSTSSSPAKGSTIVLSIECLKGSSKADEWTRDMLQTGDIVEELRIGNMIIKSPFKNGKSGVQKILHSSFKQKETSIRVRVRRGSDEIAELQACMVPGDHFVGRKQYVLRAIDDPNYAVGFADRTETDCLNLQASRTSRMVSALERSPLEDGYVSYPWERRMHEMLSIPNSSSFYSILFLPKSSDKAGSRYNDLEDTLARSHAWINASQESGAPIVFMNIQTESLLTKISGDTASSTVSAGSLSDLSNLANTSLYGFEDYHGVDIGVVRAVRLWFSPLAGEIPIEVKIKDTDTRLGFAISRTEEGFIYISSVIEAESDAPSARSGLTHLYNQASESSPPPRRVSDIQPEGAPLDGFALGCDPMLDTVSLSQKLSCTATLEYRFSCTSFCGTKVPTMLMWAALEPEPCRPPPSTPHFGMGMSENSEMPLETEPGSDIEYKTGGPGSDIMMERDTAGEFSFRQHDFALKNNWV